MLYTKNRLFAKYGHDCEITYTVDELPMFEASNNFKTKLSRKLIRMRMASEVNRRGNYYLRSQGAIAQEHYKHLKYLFMIHPFSDIRTIWEIFMMIIFLMQFVTIPLDVLTYQLAEVDEFESTFGWKIHRSILDILCLFDVGLNFITGYYDKRKKEVVLKPQRVARHYLQTHFVFDVVSSIPTHMDLVLPIDESHTLIIILQYCSILKLIRFFTFATFCEHFAETFDIKFVTFRVFTALISFILFYHFICCFFLYIFGSLFYMDDKMIFMFKENEKTVVTTGYFNTLYQSTLIICTSGYGSVMEDNLLKVLVIFMWILSKILYIYLLARVMEVVMARTSSTHKYVEMVRQLKEYMRHKQLPEFMQKRLLSYYEFRFQKSYFRESEILNTISGQLRQEIVMHSCRKLVENVGFFKNLPLTLLVRIVSCLKSEVFLVNDVIVRANTPGDSMYFISTGTVAVYTKSGKEVCHLEDGSHFGEIALVMRDELRVASVVAVEICELYRLDRKDFVRAIYPYPDLLNNVQYIAADRMERTSILDEYNRREMASKRLYN